MTVPNAVIRNTAEGLLTGTPDIVGIVQAKRDAWLPAELPGIAIYTDAETNTNITLSGTGRITVELVIECATNVFEGMEDKLETMAYEVTGRMKAFRILNYFCKYIGTTTETSADGEKPVGVKRVLYHVRYYR